MTDVTVIIPCAVYHLDIVDRAYQSALAQTRSCSIRVIVDRDGRGAGWARNEVLRQTQTPYVVFLDADDEIAPDFVERCLSVRQRGHYVYTDWIQDSQIVRAPDCAWVNRTWHPVTTLLPTAFAKAVGGFDEHLPAAEDTDFYIRLSLAGYCGQRLAQPLFTYHADGQRSADAHRSGLLKRVIDELYEKYKGKHMACCGQEASRDRGVSGERHEHDVMAETLWQGNRRERGFVTGRFYEGGWGALVWVDPRDAEYAPHLFRVIPSDPLDQLDSSIKAASASAQKPSSAAVDQNMRASRSSVVPELAEFAQRFGVRFASPEMTVIVETPEAIPTRAARAARLLEKFSVFSQTDGQKDESEQ